MAVRAKKNLLVLLNQKHVTKDASYENGTYAFPFTMLPIARGQDQLLAFELILTSLKGAPPHSGAAKGLSRHCESKVRTTYINKNTRQRKKTRIFLHAQ